MTWGMIGGAAVATVGGAMLSKGGSGSTTSTQQQQLDPRMQALLYGDGGAGQGLLGQAGNLASQPRAPGLGAFGGAADNYLKDFGASNLAGSQHAANALMAGNAPAPLASVTSHAQAVSSPAAQISAPAQNGMNLSGSYDKMINGDAGANPYLTKALQSGVDQTNASFQKNQADATNNLMRNVLPGIRSGAQAVGGYGGTRQGIAEGNAIGDFTNQMNSGNLQLGLANSANATGAQAQAFNQGQDRSLSALNTLGGQQYATAAQNAQMQQQMASQNSAQGQQTNAQNAAMYQQTNLANQNAQLSTNQLNSANTAAGAGINSGLLGQAYNYGTANDAYDRTKTGQVAGLLAPFTGYGGGSTSTQPYYTNTAGGLLGGATGALGLYNSFKQAAGGNGAASGQGIAGGGAPGQYYDGYGWMNG